MALFLSTHTNKIDNKSRVSIPSQFRSILSSNGVNSVVIYKSIINNCIECCSIERIEAIHLMIEKLDPLSIEYDYLSTSILGGSTQLIFDKEGRVVLPKNFVQEVEIEENITFIGKGNTFEMWNPENFDKHFAAARQGALQHRNMLKPA